MEAKFLERDLEVKSNRMEWFEGVKDGIPLALGYIAVAFTFGIAAFQAGLSVFQSSVISATNFTSAGQFAGVTLIVSTATLFEVALTQFIINARYFLMSAALSQKIDPKTPFWQRIIMGFGISDEVFAVSLARKGKLNPFYTYGLMTITISSWVFGTFLGAISGNILPDQVIRALSLALYAMLISIIIPPAKRNKILMSVIMISMLSSYIFDMLPVLSTTSSGLKIIILTVLISGLAALFFPVKEDTNE